MPACGNTYREEMSCWEQWKPYSACQQRSIFTWNEKEHIKPAVTDFFSLLWAGERAVNTTLASIRPTLIWASCWHAIAYNSILASFLALSVVSTIFKCYISLYAHKLITNFVFLMLLEMTVSKLKTVKLGESMSLKMLSRTALLDSTYAQLCFEQNANIRLLWLFTCWRSTRLHCPQQSYI